MDGQDTELPRAQSVVNDPSPDDWVELDFDARLIRRKRLVSASGLAFLVDLPEMISVDEGDCFDLGNNQRVSVRAAPEPLLEITGDLPRLAWHIGNRHTPCQIFSDRLVIRTDPVLAKMLEGLGASLRETDGPFRPEGGAYGHGRTMGHSH